MQIFRKAVILCFLINLASLAAIGQSPTVIGIPGTGRGIGIGAEDLVWSVYGYWSTTGQEIQGGNTVIREATDDINCISGDHTISYWEDRPDTINGPGVVYFYFPFKIIEDGTYTISCHVEAIEVDIAKYVGSGGDIAGYVSVVSDNTLPVDCNLDGFTTSLTTGSYIFRLKGHLNGGNASPAKVTVQSSGSDAANTCYPKVFMTNTSNYTVTINSGGTINIPLTSSVPANFSWQTNGNTNTDLDEPESGTSNPLVKTITNLTGTPQIITYTVIPTSTTGGCAGPPQTITVTVNAACTTGCDEIACTDCIGSFAPEAGEYIISVWVQQDDSETEMTYNGPAVALNFTSGPVATQGPFYPEGPIIDGWQRISGKFSVHTLATEIFVRLINTSDKEVYFDDLRIHPLKASLKSFVYDPVSMRLMAELDENNYATFYEYDEEGILVRVKKETERGVKTIKESLNNTRKVQ